MLLIDFIKTSFNNLKIHKMRSFLTILGLLIGVASINIVINLGAGLESYILNQFDAFGTDYVQIEIKVPATKKNSSENATGIAQGVSVTTMTLGDAKEVAKHPNIRGYFAGMIGQANINREDKNKTVNLWGSTADIFELYNANIEVGEPYSEDDDKKQARVVVLGHKVKEDFFGESDAVGQNIKIKNKNYKVLGVMEEQTGSSFFDLGEMVFVPIRTLQKQILGVNYIQFITAYMKDVDRAGETARDLTEIMREAHDITDPDKDDFSVTTADEAMDMINVVTEAITLLLVAIATISLIVGGVGIMNIMYVSVSERTYEIGLRKAVGATNFQILFQFLIEAIFLTVVGGILGIAFGTLFTWGAIAVAKNAFALNVDFSFSWIGFLVGIVFSGLVGLIFGVYPAKKAADMEPVEALREGK